MIYHEDEDCERREAQELAALRARVDQLSELIRNMEVWLGDEVPGPVRAAANDAIARWEDEV